MYKLSKTFMLIGSIALFAFSCDPGESMKGEPPSYMDRNALGITLVDKDTINLVGLEDWRRFNPSDIKILNQEMVDTGLRFIEFSLSDSTTNYDTVSFYQSATVELPDGGNVEYAREYYKDWVYTFYFEYPNGDLDTINISYEKEIRSDEMWGTYDYFYVIQKFNNKSALEPIALPELNKYPNFTVGQVYFKFLN